jgi:ArsR family transcriptional regulator
LWFFFGARQPHGVAYPSIDLSRSELLTRLNALGDDTRLRILSLLTEYEELCSQDILLKLNLSQSAVSRHLKQLSAAGFLIERSQAAAKCYRLSPRRIEDTLQALERFLLVK